MEKTMKENRFCEIRAIENENKELIIEGYAVVFDEPATHKGYTEVIDRRAFDDCDMKDVCLKYNHENKGALIMARTRSGRLKLEVDERGLKVCANLTDTTQNVDIYKLIKSGDLDKMSFAFTVARGGEEYDYSTDTRRITKIDKLFDVSIVDLPFYEGTEIHARSKEDFIKEKMDLEKERLNLMLSLYAR